MITSGGLHDSGIGGAEMRLLVTSAILMFFSLPCLSYELAQFNLIGFSADGRYLAWEEYGIQDGSGFPYCRVRIVDVVTNAVIEEESAVFELSVPDIETGQDIRNFFDEYLDDRENEYRYWEERVKGLVRPLIADRLESLGILSGNLGSLVVHHPLTDRTNFSSSIQFVSGWIGPWYKASPQFELVIDQQEIPLDSGVTSDFSFLDVFLSIRIVDLDSGQSRTLLDEVGSGERTESAFTYGILSIYIYHDDYIAVVLYKYQNGFEGPDVRFRVVTGELPDYEQTFWYSTGH